MKAFPASAMQAQTAVPAAWGDAIHLPQSRQGPENVDTTTDRVGTPGRRGVQRRQPRRTNSALSQQAAGATWTCPAGVPAQAGRAGFQVRHFFLKRCSRRALPITDTELRLMARAAINGDSSHPVRGYSKPAAMGMPKAL